MGKADLHIHTRHSDGLASPETVLRWAEERTDLDVIAITDHEDVEAALRARELAARRGYRVEVVVGAEVTTLQGHLLALFIEERPPLLRSVERTLEWIHERGGIAVVPHPMSWLTRSLGRRAIDRVCARQEPGVTFDAIELANPSPAGRPGREAALRLNRERWHLPATGSSDAHHLLHIGRGWTNFPGRTAEELRVALLEGTISCGMVPYPSAREVGYGNLALGLAYGLTATPRKAARRVWERLRP
ncbi:5'-3' exoribonuclease [bacterium HR29]|nr:5'-3' exoribonuclease [bacterium HR29]